MPSATRRRAGPLNAHSGAASGAQGTVLIPIGTTVVVQTPRRHQLFPKQSQQRIGCGTLQLIPERKTSEFV